MKLRMISIALLVLGGCGPHPDPLGPPPVPECPASDWTDCMDGTCCPPDDTCSNDGINCSGPPNPMLRMKKK